MEAVVRDPFLYHTRHCRGFYFSAEGGRQAGTCVVDQNDEDVRGIGRKPSRLNALLINRLLHRATGDARRRSRWKRQGILLGCFVIRAHLSDLIPPQPIQSVLLLLLPDLLAPFRNSGHWNYKNQTTPYR